MTSILVDARVSWAGGIGRYVANTLPLVAASLPHVEFELLVTPTDAERAHVACAHAPNITLKVVDIPSFTLAEQWKISALAKRHSLTWFTNYWVPLGFRRPFVTSVHDMLHLEPVLFPASPIKRALSWLTFSHVSRRALGIAYVSRFTRREFERRFGRPRQAVVSRLGLDHRDWTPFDPDRPLQKERRIMLVAAPKYHKNFEIAVTAFNASKLGREWKLTVVLPQLDLRSSIDVGALARENTNIELRAALTNEELRDLYDRSAILLMPSMYEGFGLPLAEGLQAGATCISSIAEALVEVGQGANVVWVSPRDLDGWIMAIEDAGRRWDDGTVDRGALVDNMHHAASFRWADVAQQTTALFCEVLGVDAKDPGQRL